MNEATKALKRTVDRLAENSRVEGHWSTITNILDGEGDLPDDPHKAAMAIINNLQDLVHEAVEVQGEVLEAFEAAL